MRHVQIKIMFILPIIDGKKAHRNNCMNDVRLLDTERIKNTHRARVDCVANDTCIIQTKECDFFLGEKDYFNSMRIFTGIVFAQDFYTVRYSL